MKSVNRNTKPILIVGPPRSGTTWVANILSVPGNVKYIHEPDNEKITALAHLWKNNLRRFPYVRVGEDHKQYLKLFADSFKGDLISSKSPINKILYSILKTNKEKVEEGLSKTERNLPEISSLQKASIKSIIGINKLLPLPNKRVLVKSVHSCFSIPYLMHHFDFDPLIVLRHPASVVSSSIKLNMPDANRKIINNKSLFEDFLKPFEPKIKKLNSRFELMGLQIGIFHYVLNTYIKKFNLNYVLHESLCIETEKKFKNLYKMLNLDWDDTVVKKINALNKEGNAYQVKRISADTINAWKQHLTKEEVEQIKLGYNIFNIGLYPDFESN